MEKCFVILVLAIMYSLMTPALSINVGFSSGNADETFSSSSAYDLDKSTSLQELVTLGDGRISKGLFARGSGRNRISISSSAKDKSTSSEIESSGNFQTSAFTGTSSESVGISQDTALSGSYGGITYNADSQKNKMVISSGFEGEGDLKAGISLAAGENAAISGNVNALGVEMLDSESMQIIGSGDIAMSVDGLSNGGLGSFSLSASNAKKETVSNDTSALLTGPAYTDDGGRADAHILLGYRLNTKDPQLKWVLKNDANMAAEGLSASEVQSAIEGAANTWDDSSNQNLFADSNMVTLNPTTAAEKYDNIHTINWKPFAKNCNSIAYAKTYYTLSTRKKVDGYNTVLDSDLVFNSNYAWTTGSSRTSLDFQSVALHEMGHTLGLGDIYGKPEFASDNRQVMHYYTGFKRTLGNGDKTGIWKLYQ